MDTRKLGRDRLIALTPWIWAFLAFFIGWYYAQFVSKIGWNAIELIIAQHLLGHGEFVTSLDYQSAIAWRPIVPTLIVTAFRLFSENPLEIYRMICGLAFASLGASMYLAGKRLWGTLAGHCAAVLALACPAMTTELIHHIHSYSHVGTLLVFGPALLVSLSLLRENVSDDQRKWTRYLLCGVLWGLVYLCRSELMLFALLHFLALGIVHFRTGSRWRRLAFAVVPFFIILLSYNSYADYVCRRDGILIRKPIYGMYMSQGWSDPPPNVGPDIEGEGYLYAIQLYGKPTDNQESMVRAILHNPTAFTRRVKINAINFYSHYWDDRFFPRIYSLAALAALVLYAFELGRRKARDPLVVPYLLMLFLISHFILIFHIDARYLTINIPALILLASYALSRAPRLSTLPGWRPVALAAVVVVLLLQARRQFHTLQAHGPRNETGMIVMRALGEHFVSLGLKGTSSGNREPHILFDFPAKSPLAPEDQFLLPYYSNTAWVNGGAEGAFPRGRFYSFRDSPIDYRYVPAEKMSDPNILNGMRIISDCEIPIIGKYFLLQATPNR